MQVLSKYLMLNLIVLFTLNTQAQDFELLKLESSYYPSQSVDDSTIDADIALWEWRGEVAIPQPLKSKKTVLIHRLGYSNLRVDLETSAGILDTEVTKYYHTISYSLGAVQILNPKWKLILNLNPVLASDFEESLGEDDLLLQSSALAMKSNSKKFTYGFGLAYTNRFGRPAVVPLAMFKYKTPKMTINALLPNMLSLSFDSHERLEYGFVAALDGRLFNNNGEIRAVDAVVDETGYSRLNVGPALKWKMENGIILKLNTGVALARRLDFIDIHEDTFDRSPKPGPFFRLGLAFAPKKKKGETSSEN